MLNNLSDADFSRVLKALFKKSNSGELVWEPWSGSGLDEEYVASTDAFKYYVGREEDSWDEVVRKRVEIWKLRAAADEKHLLIQQVYADEGENTDIDRLFDLARSSALNLGALAPDILRDLGES